MTNNKNTNKRILVIRLSALGDVAMTLPVVYSLAKQYPALHVTMLTTPFFARLFINRPENLEIMAVDLKKDYHGASGLFRLLKRLAGMKFDYVADLHNVLRSWMIDTMFRLKGISVKMVDKGRKERMQLLHNDKSLQTKSYIQRYVDTFESLGLPVALDFHSLFEGIDISTPCEIKEHAIGIAPFARYMNKTYPLDKITELVRLMTGKGFTVYLFGGGKKEQELLENIEKQIPDTHSLAGKYPIEDELRIMSKMQVMVSMDSANQHLASLAGTPVISIWGSTTPACGFMGYRQNPDNALYLGLDCQPCTIAGSEKCPKDNLNCMNELSPEVVANKIMSIIKQ